MKKERCLLVVFIALFCFVFFSVVSAEINIGTPAWQKVKDLGKQNSYVFLLFSDAKAGEDTKILATIEEVKQELTKKKTDIVKVVFNDPKEKNLLTFFRITETPTVLVVAPNGAITGYFVKNIDKQTLAESLISLNETKIIKNLQEGRVVFLCFYEDKTANFTTIKTSLESVADNFKGVVNVIYVSSNDKEKKLREKFKISSETATAFIIVPPGRTVAKLEGDAITKTNLMQSLMSSCGSGCGSGCK